MSAPDMAPVTAAAGVEDPAPARTGFGALLDILARQLLAQRSGLEAIRLQAVTLPPIVAGVDSLLDQLDAAFATVGVAQAMADLQRAAATMDSPTTPAPERAAPRVFGRKHTTGDVPAPPTTAGGNDGQQG